MDIWCPDCDKEFESDEWEGKCPYCGRSWYKDIMPCEIDGGWDSYYIIEWD